MFPLAGNRRSATRGLARVEPEDNTLVAYAAKDGTVAMDSTGGANSPFTAALLKHMATPGLEVDYLLRLVRDDVVAATNRQQTPHTYGTLGTGPLLSAARGGGGCAGRPHRPPSRGDTNPDRATRPAGRSRGDGRGHRQPPIASTDSRSLPLPSRLVPLQEHTKRLPPHLATALRKASDMAAQDKGGLRASLELAIALIFTDTGPVTIMPLWWPASAHS